MPPPPPQPPFYPSDGGNTNYPFDNFPPPPSFDNFGQSPSHPDLERPERKKYFPFTARFPTQDNDNDDDNNDLEYDTYGNNFFRPVQNHKIALDENLQHIFPDADRVFQADPQEVRENVKFENFSTKFEKGEIPSELEFFQGERNENFGQNLNYLGLSHENEQFVDYLTSEECRDILEREDIQIHIDSGDIFVNNQNTGKSIYDFLLNQQDENKKKLPIDFSYDDNYTDYIIKYLPGINEVDDDKFDVLTNKNSKYLFHLFNKYQESRNRPKQFIRHSVISDNNYALRELQNRNWPYFINRIIYFSQQGDHANVSEIGVNNTHEANILYNTRANLNFLTPLVLAYINYLSIWE